MSAPGTGTGSTPKGSSVAAGPRQLGAWLEAFVRAPAFLEKYPYYAAVLARLSPLQDPSVKYMAVSLEGERFYLHVNVDYFVREPQYLTGILLHEVHHVALGHLTHAKFQEAVHRDLMELAMEMSANEYVEEPLPDPIVWQQFERYGVRAGQSTLERYKRLCALRTSGTDVQPREGSSSTTDDHGPWERSPPHPGAQEQARRLLSDAVGEVNERREKQQGEKSEGLPKPRIAGRDPGRLMEELFGVSGPPEVYVDWRSALRAFSVRARAPVHTYARPSRRFPRRVGEIPGRTWVPRKAERPSILVAIDTSMSMTREELSEVSRQLRHVAENARVTVAECDTEVQRVYGFDGALPVSDVRGRGGTDLRPVFAPEFLRSVRPDGVVYFTDGEGPFDDAPPPVPTLWVLTKPQAFECPWGERARMHREPGAERRATGRGRGRRV